MAVLMLGQVSKDFLGQVRQLYSTKATLATALFDCPHDYGLHLSNTSLGGLTYPIWSHIGQAALQYAMRSFMKSCDPDENVTAAIGARDLRSNYSVPLEQAVAWFNLYVDICCGYNFWEECCVLIIKTNRLDLFLHIYGRQLPTSSKPPIMIWQVRGHQDLVWTAALKSPHDCIQRTVAMYLPTPDYLRLLLRYELFNTTDLPIVLSMLEWAGLSNHGPAILELAMTTLLSSTLMDIVPILIQHGVVHPSNLFPAFIRHRNPRHVNVIIEFDWLVAAGYQTPSGDDLKMISPYYRRQADKPWLYDLSSHIRDKYGCNYIDVPTRPFNYEPLQYAVNMRRAFFVTDSPITSPIRSEATCQGVGSITDFVLSLGMGTHWMPEQDVRERDDVNFSVRETGHTSREIRANRRMVWCPRCHIRTEVQPPPITTQKCRRCNYMF